MHTENLALQFRSCLSICVIVSVPASSALSYEDEMQSATPSRVHLTCRKLTNAAVLTLRYGMARQGKVWQGMVWGCGSATGRSHFFIC